VKLAKVGSRMAELLPLEHLALRSLSEVGVPASASRLLMSGDCVFLEVKRFDRVGRNGRIGMLSAGAVDDEFFGRRDSWPEFAARCEQAKLLSSEHARRVDTLAAFSELIGNGDRHFENISLLIDEAGEYSGIAPAYDVLPMRYASLGGGVDPDLLPIAPRVGTIGAKPAVWGLAWRAAERFWLAVQTEQMAVPISQAMKEVAAENLAVALAFVEPLLPQGVVRLESCCVQGWLGVAVGAALRDPCINDGLPRSFLESRRRNAAHAPDGPCGFARPEPALGPRGHVPLEASTWQPARLDG
jgi:hypothetical protein